MKKMIVAFFILTAPIAFSASLESENIRQLVCKKIWDMVLDLELDIHDYLGSPPDIFDEPEKKSFKKCMESKNNFQVAHTVYNDYFQQAVQLNIEVNYIDRTFHEFHQGDVGGTKITGNIIFKRRMVLEDEGKGKPILSSWYIDNDNLQRELIDL